MGQRKPGILRGHWRLTLLFVKLTASVSSWWSWWFRSCFSRARMYPWKTQNSCRSVSVGVGEYKRWKFAKRRGRCDTSSIARTQGPHFHALLPEDPSAAATVRTPQPSHSGERGMVRRHLASSWRDALRPCCGAERSSCFLSSRSSACFEI
jgi:hypothetical protein